MTDDPNATRSLIPDQACPNCAQRAAFAEVSGRLRRCTACRSLCPLPDARAALDRALEANAAAAWAEEPVLSPGRVIRERYRLQRRIGRGAHGVTFLAEHLLLGHPCVIKFVPLPAGADTEQSVVRLRAEARAGFRVQSPHVVRVLDCDVSEGYWFFVMEFIDCVDLGVAVAARATLDWRQAVRLGAAAARGLAAIHDAGMVHRDIKPDNLLLGADGRLRIADLGIAGVARDPADPHSRLAARGAIAYASPECFDPELRPDARADLYSLGATLFHLVSGRLPRGSRSLLQTVIDSQVRAVEWPADAAEDAPPWFVGAVLRLLERRPEDRFASATALAEFLERPDGAPADAERTERLEPRGVVVLSFRNEAPGDENDWLSIALADHLSRSLGQVRGVYVADRDEFGRVRDRLRGDELENDRTRILAAGRLVGAAHVIEGCFRREREALDFSARVHSSGQGEPLALGAIRGPIAELPRLQQMLAERTIQALNFDSDARDATPLQAVALEAQEKFFRAKQSFLRGDYSDALGLGLAAIRQDAGLGEAVGFVGTCYARLGQYDSATEYHQRQEDVGLRQRDAKLLVEARANIGAMYYFRGDYARADDYLRRAAQTAETFGLTLESSQIANNLGFVLLRLGKADDAGEAFGRAIETLRRYGALVSLIGPYNGMGNVLREQARYDDARASYARALSLAQESGDTVNVGISYMHLGQTAMLQGRLADAKVELALALTHLEETHFWNGQARVYEVMTDLNVRIGNSVEAGRCADRRIELARRHANRPMEAAAWRQKARILTLAGRGDEATECEEAARAAEAATATPPAAAAQRAGG